MIDSRQDCNMIEARPVITTRGFGSVVALRGLTALSPAPRGFWPHPILTRCRTGRVPRFSYVKYEEDSRAS
jgi:hypothetical protein